jgi:hypothetical protein
MVLAVLPTVPWWVGPLAALGLRRERSPSGGLLLAWWLVLSVMTPLYHPYARLWLPIHGAGWMLLAGLVVSVGSPWPNRVFVQGEAEKSTSRRRVGPVMAASIAVLVILVTALHASGRARGKPLAVSRYYRPTTSLSDAVAMLPKFLPRESAPNTVLFVLARRPVAFYLTVQARYRFQLVPDVRALEGLRKRLPTSSDGGPLALVDDVQVAQDLGDRVRAEAVSASLGDVLGASEEVLDPVTLLDVDSSAASGGGRARKSTIAVIRLASPRLARPAAPAVNSKAP